MQGENHMKKLILLGGVIVIIAGILLFLHLSVPTIAVTYLDDDESIIAIKEYSTNESVPFPEDPSKEGYTFIGWDKKEDNVYIAVYQRLVFEVLFFVRNELVETVEVYYGDSIEPPTVSTSENEFFRGWDKEAVNITENMAIFGDFYPYLFDQATGAILEYLGTESDVVIPDMIAQTLVVRIEEEAFRNKQLTSVIIPDSITFIGAAAFGDNLLQSVELPNSALTIERGAFVTNKLTHITIPATIVELGPGVFTNNLLTSVSIPEELTVISDTLFNNNLLTSVDLPPSLEIIGDGAFLNNQLTHIEIPEGVKRIGNSAFAVNQLTRVEIPNSVVEVDIGAFMDNQIESVVFPEGITELAFWLFRNNRLSTILIPDTVTHINEGAFENNLITDLTIPGSLIEIGINAFKDNPLTSITIEGEALWFYLHWEFYGFPAELNPEGLE